MEKKKSSSSHQIDFRNPFLIWGFTLMIIGVVGGGAIGGALGAVSWIIMSRIGTNKNFSTLKKIIFCILTTLGCLLLYFLAAIILLPLFK